LINILEKAVKVLFEVLEKAVKVLFEVLLSYRLFVHLGTVVSGFGMGSRKTRRVQKHQQY